MADPRASVLFVCTGNICRSPTAEGVFRHLAASRGVLERLRIDSAGSHDYHAGEAPPALGGTRAPPRLRPHDASRAPGAAADFTEFGWILAMDRGHLRLLEASRPRASDARVELFLDHSQGWKGEDVPDPYYGGVRGFELVLDHVEEACEGLLAAVLAGASR